MIPRVLGSLAIVIYALVVPILELNQTHLFNSEWPPHARTHEAWQLITNSSFGLFGLWLIWKRDNLQLAGIISVLVMGSFLIAFLLQDFYGGSMAISSTQPQKTVFGFGLGVFGALLSTILALASIVFARHSKRRSATSNG
jgi:hypothetical protein